MEEEKISSNPDPMKGIIPNKNGVKKWILYLVAGVILILIALVGFIYVTINTTEKGTIENNNIMSE